MIRYADIRGFRLLAFGFWIGCSHETNPKAKSPKPKLDSSLDSTRLLAGIHWFLLLLLLTPVAVFAQDEARIQALAEDVLATRYPDDAHRLHVRVKRVEGDWGDEAALRLDFPSEDRLPRGTTQVKLFAGSDEAGWQKAGWALLYVSRYDSVVVARAPLRSGDEVTTADVSVAWMETTTIRGTLLHPAELRALSRAGSLFAARSVGEGRVLRHDTLRPAYAAEIGTTVMMHFARSGLQLNLSCKARQAGHIDDEIRLYSADTGKTYRARLTGLGVATWIETL